jgi:hypothetical protein
MRCSDAKSESHGCALPCPNHNQPNTSPTPKYNTTQRITIRITHGKETHHKSNDQVDVVMTKTACIDLRAVKIQNVRQHVSPPLHKHVRNHEHQASHLLCVCFA